MYPRRKEEVAQSDSRNCALLACGGKGVYGASDTCSLGPKSPDAGRILDSPKMPELLLEHLPTLLSLDNHNSRGIPIWRDLHRSGEETKSIKIGEGRRREI